MNLRSDSSGGSLVVNNMLKKQRSKIMSNNKIVVPEAKAALEQFKMEAANEEDVPTPY